MIKIKSKGSFNNLQIFLKRASGADLTQILTKYAYEGVAALYAATPKRTGKTAASWTFEIVQNGKNLAIYWKNTNVIDNNCIAILIQQGHSTRRGGYVQGIDYINPAMKPVFERMANEAWLEVTSNE